MVSIPPGGPPPGPAGVDEVFIFGSWAAAWAGEQLSRPIGDLDLLVLGDPDPDVLYPAVDRAGQDLNRQVLVQIRRGGWLQDDEGSFHETVIGRPILRIYPDEASTSCRVRQRLPRPPTALEGH